MHTQRTLEAVAMKDGKWWEISIPELDQVTSTKKLSEVQEYADSLAAAILDVPEGAVTVNVTYELPEAAKKEWAKAREETDKARELSMSAAEHTRRVVRGLHAEGYTVRDIEKVLGISFQRASQLLKD